LIVWLYPLALSALIAIIGPIGVHLLRRQRAPHMILPSVRFIPVLDQSSVRIRTPTDLRLLLLRAAIIGCAALALARPLFLTDAVRAAWAQRTARVVVVDTGASARGSVSPEAIRAAALSADPVVTIETPDVGPALEQAAAWLANSPPARREIVVLSDFQQGSITAEDVAQVTAGIGLRLLPPGDPAPATRDLPPTAILNPDGVLDVRSRIDAARTLVRYETATSPAEGLEIVANAADVARLRRVVALAGAQAPSAAQPIVIRFQQPALPATAVARDADWTFAAGQRLLRTPGVSGLPISVAGAGGSLIVDVGVDPQSVAAAEVVKAALDARLDPHALAELEVTRIPGPVLAGWSRDPAPPDPGAWQQSDQSHGRWLWGLALALLGIESLVRRSNPAVPDREAARAA
jgi:hypothetical protein